MFRNVTRLSSDLAGSDQNRPPCEDLRALYGSSHVDEPDGVSELPERVHLFECRLRVKGQRHHFRGPNWGWAADPQALWRVVDAGVEWCIRDRPDLRLTLKVRTLPARVLDPDQKLERSIRAGLEASAQVGVVRLTSGAPERFRTVVVEPSIGRVSLVDGGAKVETGWEQTRRDLRAMMQITSDSTVYGFLKRGSYRPAAESGYSLSEDWPPADHHEPAAQLGQAFEDQYAPDAFGVQLLGAGYAGRAPRSADWTHTPIAGDGVIVEHGDPAAWYAQLLMPFGGHPNYTQPPIPPVPSVLAQARSDFSEILFRDEIAWQSQTTTEPNLKL